MSEIELYKKYRPSKFSEMVGQDEAIQTLQSFGKRGSVPHCVLFTGPSGCGKTTAARIMKEKLKCSDSDYFEMNIADFRGIDMVREIRQRMSLAPIGGTCRIWLLDECHKITSDAQDALLKILEDTPSHVYFFLATTDPQKLKTTIKTRATEIKLKLLEKPAIAQLVTSIAASENRTVSSSVVDKICEVAEGSARKAIVLLNSVLWIDDEEKQLASIAIGEGSAEGIELARTLMNSKSNFGDVAKILKKLSDEPESVRYLILGYARSVLLNGGPLSSRAASVIECFQFNFFDSKQAGLALACYKVYG